MLQMEEALLCSAETRPSKIIIPCTQVHKSRYARLPTRSACNWAARCCQFSVPDAMLALTETMGFLDACSHYAHEI